MKKISLMLVLVMIFQILLVSCGPIVSGNQGNTQDGSGDEQTPTPDDTTEDHEHSFSDKLTYDKSYHFYACECGEVTGSQHHEYGEWLTVKEATETEDGQKRRECNTCDYIQIVAIPGEAHVHAVDGVAYDEVSHWEVCACGSAINLNAHAFGNWVVTTEATESASGIKMRKCTDCEYSEFETIPMLQKGETVFEWTKIAIQNVGTSQYMNYDYGTLENGNELRVWPWDGSEEQLFSIKNVSSNTYRILTNKSSSYAIDVFRDGKALAAGMKLDIWKAGNDATAQNIKLHLCSDGSYILRMANNMNLAISSNGAKNQLVLAKFDESNANQKWIFKDSTGAKIDIRDPMPTAAGITEDKYVMTGVRYSIEGKYYYQAYNTVAYNEVPENTSFFLNEENKVVTNYEILSKLSKLEFMRDNDVMLNSIASSLIDSKSVLDAYVSINAMNKLGEIVGAGSGTLLQLGTGATFTLGEAAIEIVSGSSEDDVRRAIYIALVKFFANNCHSHCRQYLALSEDGFASYEEAVEALSHYANARASYNAMMHIAGDEIIEYSKKTEKDVLRDYFKTVFKGMVDSILPDLDALKIAGYISSGKALLNDFYMSSGLNVIYDEQISAWQNVLDKGVSTTIKQNADRLASNEGVSGTKYVAAGLVEKLNKVMQKYPEGTNVSHSYTFPSTSAWECHGFACYALMSFWGTKKPGVTNTAEYKAYKATATESYVDKIRPGDLVRFRYNGYDHTIVVTNVDDDNIYYADCNSDLKCTFRYNKVMSKSTLASYLVKKLGSQQVSERGYILHYKNNDL